MDLKPGTHEDRPPRAGASIAVFQARKILLVRRKHSPFAGLWSLPGGKVEGNEAPRETACRELQEETGITAEIDGVVDTATVAAGADGDRRAAYRLTVFYGRATGGCLKVGGDAEAAEWVHLDEIEARAMTPGTADLIWIAAHKVRS